MCAVRAGLSLWLLLTAPAGAAEFVSGLALHGAPKYASAFTHFDYADPTAPKGGELRLAAIGTFDSLNPYILRGVAAAGTPILFDTLMQASLDEPFSQYGLLAQSVRVADDQSAVTYKLRPEARFNDGAPVTPEDVLFSFDVLREKGHPSYRNYYKDVARAEKTGADEVTFTFAHSGNTELPLIMGQLPVFSRAFWQGKDFATTTLSPIVGSGPYEIASVAPGRQIVFRRIKNWWGENLPVNKGRYNFDKIVYDYYRDADVVLEALFAGRYDLRIENSAKNWATAYTSPAVKSGKIIKALIPNALPSGMQAFIFNSRRPMFADPRVREALGLAFDFEWSNKNVAFGAYARTNSFFANSELAATGLPSPEERALLTPYKGKIPNEVFTTAYQAPTTDGSGIPRDNLRRAGELLDAAGWLLKDGKRVNAAGQTLSFEIVDSSPLFERWVLPFVKNLERIGVKAHFRVVDSAQYQNLMNDFAFDMTIHVFGQSLSPGNEQRDFWGSSSADRKGSRNLIGIKDEAIDGLVEKIVAARTRAELIIACRALDRVLLWGHYVIPHWNFGSYRLAYWDKFGHPTTNPPYGLDIEGLWWEKEETK